MSAPLQSPSRTTALRAQGGLRLESRTNARIGAPIQMSRISEDERLEGRLAFEAHPLVASLRGRMPTALELQQISVARGPELAAMVFVKAAQASPLHAGFARAIARAKPAREPSAGPRLEAVVIPDGTPGTALRWGSFVGVARECARRAGYQTDYVETQHRSSVSTNARAIADFVESRPDDARLVFVSFGVGSAEVRFYLQKSGPRHAEKHFGRIRGWLNVAGAFGGAARLDGQVDGPISRLWTQASCAFSGRSYGSIAEASSRFGAWREPLSPPPRALFASLVPTPLPMHLPKALRRSYRALASRGPSDGAVLLADSAARPGLIYPAWGFCHETPAADWAFLIERAMAVMAEALAARPAEPPAPDLSVEYAETDPDLRRAKKLADRIAEQKRAAARSAERAARARAAREAQSKLAPQAPASNRPPDAPQTASAQGAPGPAPAPIATASPSPEKNLAAPPLDDVWSGALVDQGGRARFDAAEWEMAQFFSKRTKEPAASAGASAPLAGVSSSAPAPDAPAANEEDEAEDRFEFR